MTQTVTIAKPNAPILSSSPLSGSVLVVDDHANARRSLADTLQALGCQATCRASAVEALKLCDQQSFDCIVTDLQMPGMSGLEFLRQLEQRNCDVPVVMITAHASIDTAVEAMRHGALDYLEKPIRIDQLESVIGRALDQSVASSGRSRMLSDERSATAMIGESQPMRQLRERIARVAPTDETVLVCGESGVGKELVAQEIHAASRRASSAMVSVNCPALSPQLLESELFGHEKGAFTGADTSRVGRFELAHCGTLLLDEVTEIELPQQAKLLRVLQEMTLERVGSSRSLNVDVRVLATTNRDLNEYVAQGSFRQDLYFRLAVVPLEVPPLRARADDIPLLAKHFLGEVAKRMKRPACELTDAATNLLAEYHWPGNVRELENLMTRISVLAADQCVDAAEIQPLLLPVSPGHQAISQPTITPGESLHEMERMLIEATLEKFNGHRGQTAKALGIGVRTLANKLRGYGYGPRAKVGTV